MSFSKRLNSVHCRNCLSLSRQLTSQSTNAERQFYKMSGVQVKSVATNQWKIINQLKEQLKNSDKNTIMLLLNKEWNKIINRIPSLAIQAAPKTTHKHYSKSSLAPGPEGTTSVGNEPEGNFSLTPIFNDIRSKFQQKTVVVEDDKVKWKVQKSSISPSSINSRTRHVLSAVGDAETSSSRLKRLEDLIDHFYQYPEAVNIAVKEGAIRMLLFQRKAAKDEPTLGAVKEALAILGFVDPLPGRGIRILSVDGGGVRGLLVIEMLRKLEELTGRRVHEMFDYICGVSTGSVIACTIGTSKKTLDEVTNLYKLLSFKIFTQNAFYGTRSLLWSHAYYDTALWESILQEHVGHETMIRTARINACPKIGAVSTIVNQGRVQPFIFRNYAMPFRIRSQYMGSYKYELWEAARASAAAPSYFEECNLDGLLHQDGGILVNNPTAVALHEAKQLWPNQPIQCLVSFGTGRISPIVSYNQNQTEVIPKGSSWAEKFYKILDSATDTEAVHTMLNDLLPSSVYYRFNPYLTEMLSMVEYQPEKLKLLEQDAHMYVRRNEERFREAANTLLQPRTYTQSARDWLDLQSTLVGIK